jgi:hypothetical protein
MLAKGEEVEHVDLAPWVKRLERAGAEEDVTMIQRMLAVGTGYVTGFGADAEEGPPSASEGVGMVAKGKSSEITSVASAARLG